MGLLVKALTEPLDLYDGKGAALIDKKRLHVLHINHMLRGADSDGDEAFVVETCKRFEVPCTVRRIDIPKLMEEVGDSNMENVARHARYDAAYALVDELCAQRHCKRDRARIVTAHTADDRVETFFMRAIEGASTTGLASIKPLRDIIARPLLSDKREDLRALLTEHNVGWREDATNDDTTRFRAFVRHEVIPLGLAKNPAMIDTLASSLDVMLDEDAFLTATAQDALTFATVDKREGLIALESGKLSHLDIAIARRVILLALRSVADEDTRFESRHIKDALSGVAHKPYSVSLPGGVEVRREFDDLVFKNKHKLTEKVCASWLRVPGFIDLGQGGIVSARLIEVPPGANPIFLAKSLSVPYEHAPAFSPLVFDADKIGLTEEALVSGEAQLRLDSPQAGDEMRPFGMPSGSKKVFDILTEARIPLRDRAQIPVVRAKEGGPIVCIAGIRLDRRVQCSPESSRLVELSFQPPRQKR